MKYQQIVNQYDSKISELQRQSDATQREIEALNERKRVLQEQQNIESGNVSVSSGNANVISVLQQETDAVDEQLVSKRTVKEVTDSSIRQMQSQKNIDLNAYEKENVAAIENNILGYEQSLKTYEGAQREHVSGRNALMEQGTENELGNLVAREIHSVAGELENIRQSQIQLLGQIESLEQSITNTTVRAGVDGRVNFAVDLVEGDYIAAGTQVLSIIPNTDTGSFKVRSYIENRDIAKIKEGMNVTYEIGAYPSREYGTITGQVLFVSADLKVDDNGSAYYVVETSVDAEELRNRAGKEVDLKVGMLCETRIVIEEKRILDILIDKIFHITN